MSLLSDDSAPGSPVSGGQAADSPGLPEDSDGSWVRPSSVGPEAPFSKAGTSSASLHAPVPEAARTHGQRTSYDNFLASAISNSISEASPRLPWEHGIWAASPAYLRQPFKYHSVGMGDLFVPASQPVVLAPVSGLGHSYPDFVKRDFVLGPSIVMSARCELYSSGSFERLSCRSQHLRSSGVLWSTQLEPCRMRNLWLVASGMLLCLRVLAP